jgi:beta-1,4-mannosyl-glycoprotein beta-1,4-N-acetylglucosaminyltransferase
MWNDIVNVIPDASLDICSYHPFPSSTEDIKMNEIILSNDSITHHGKLNTNELYELMSKSEYWLYTNTTDESSCITALEMLMNKVVCLYYPLAGLNDTIGDYGISVNPGEEIETILTLSTEKKELLRENGREYARSCSWKNRAEEWSTMLGLDKTKQQWTFYCSHRFEKKMVRQYIDNLNNIFHNYRIYLTSDIELILATSPEKVTFVYEVFDSELISNLPNTAFSFLNTEPLNIPIRLDSVNNILKLFPNWDYYDYSEGNLKILEETGINIQDKIYLPYKCSDDELEKLINLNTNTKKEYDFGIINGSNGVNIDRRQDIVNSLKQNKYTINIISGWNDDRDMELAKCKTILNIHGFYQIPSNIFEHIRCDRLLEAGFNVLSETSYKLNEEFVNKYPNLKQISYDDFFNMKTIYINNIGIPIPNKEFIKIRDYRYDVCNKGQSSGLDLNKYVKKCIDNIGSSNITNICDIGCGMGEHSKLLLSQYPNFKFTGIDWSQLTINYLNNNTSFFHEIIHCKSSNLPFNNKQFSVALCMENLEHLYTNDCIDAFKELKRISDYVIITIPRPEYIVNRHWLNKEIAEASNDKIPILFKDYIALESCVHKTGYYESSLIRAGFKKCDIEHPYNGIYSCKSNDLDISKIQYTGIDSNDLLQTSNYKEKYIDLLHKSLNLKFIQNQPKIIDCFIFYNELDMLTYRLNILNDIVDYFVLVEATHSFVGKEKSLFYQENKQLFQKFNHKIIHVIIDDFPHKYPNINFEKKEQWNNEKFQRNCISRGLYKLELNNEDLIIIADVDEIPKIELLENIKYNEMKINEVKALQMDFYYYNLHSKLDHYTDVVRMLPYNLYKNINMTIDDLRFKYQKNFINNAGWHLSYFGDENFIKNKIENFAHQELNLDLFTNQEKIQQRIKNTQDLFDRPTKLINIPIEDNDNLPPAYDKYLTKYYTNNKNEI